MIKYVVLGVALFVASASVSAVSVSAMEGKNSGQNKVTLCHATHSATNPYVKITVSVNAAGSSNDNGKGDHAHHTGPIATSKSVAEDFKKNHVHWGDIIPAGEYNTSLNWTAEGKAMFENDCKSSVVVTSTVEKEVEENTSTVEELPQTGSSSALLVAFVASGIVYAAASLSSLLRRSA